MPYQAAMLDQTFCKTRSQNLINVGEVGEIIMKILQICALAAAVTVVAGCQSTNSETTGAVTGAALGTGVGLVTGGSFGQVVGAGLIGGRRRLHRR